MNCASCSLSNLNYLENCDFCGEMLQTTAEAEVRKREWDALPETAKEEFAAETKKARQRMDDWLEWLRRSTRKHSIIGAIFFGIPTTVCMSWLTGGGFILFILLVVDLATGAALGYLLNKWRGGEYRGMWMFGITFVVSSFFKAGAGAVFISFESGWSSFGPVVMTTMGLLCTFTAGYAFGLNLTLERSDH